MKCLHQEVAEYSEYFYTVQAECGSEITSYIHNRGLQRQTDPNSHDAEINQSL